MAKKSQKRPTPLEFFNTNWPFPCSDGDLVKRYLEKGKFRSFNTAYERAPRMVKIILWDWLKGFAEYFDSNSVICQLEDVVSDWKNILSDRFLRAAKAEIKQLDSIPDVPNKVRITLGKSSYGSYEIESVTRLDI